jgi:esterase
MRLHFQVHGEGFPLIIAHGFLGSLDNWRTMSTRLAAHCRVYAVDLRNHGRSPHSNVMNYLVMAQDLREFIENHGLRSPVILGHSMGGKVAMQLALQYPEQVDKLVIVDIAPKSYPSMHLSAVSDCKPTNPLGRSTAPSAGRFPIHLLDNSF